MTIRSILFGAAAAVLLASSPALAAGGETPRPERMSWSFAGPFGMYDQGQLQRGFKVFKEVCAACHSANFLYFRNLAQPGGPGFTEAQAKQVASEYQITDGPNDAGDMFQRPGRLSDHWPAPFPNDNAARASNGGALPPDLSVIAKARSYHVGFPGFITDAFIQYQEHGVDYIHALLTGYVDPPADAHVQPGLHYNTYFPGHQIAMPKPISDGQVEYTDGAPQTVEQYSEDVSAFLMWLAEPHLDARKRIGFQVMIFLLVFAGLLYFTKKKVWKNVAH
ncbi:cytochrome c1 [Xanthobacter tagetidis]|uniref:Cytochrome c1 n=1 Tax=Xanthobacter tagetidis TaxID=60216 RepID=A0A3L7A7B2_9HYPH|nr:cytochrome c1 [Xanthobacter tagetidis]MBB6308351.1 ubiquinol-cytochrome c reductase cytochrome b/c1 subunit [Xanthobacter tagetidis]RLP76219.1 cytochrome c1 [Xanthobacter tagetidis]